MAIWSPFWSVSVLRPSNEHAYLRAPVPVYVCACACVSECVQMHASVCVALVLVARNYKSRIRRIGQSRAAIAGVCAVI